MIPFDSLDEIQFSPAELARYARQITLPQVGIEGQKRLKKARILCIGAGGLGSPVTMYLAAAGIGKLGIVDPDVVDVSNLHRQLLHGESEIDQKKTASAKRRLFDINPHIEIETYEARFTSANAMSIADGYDLIIDGTDNFPTRYLSNDVAFFRRIPNVYGSIYQFEGQVSVFAPHDGGPCYRCLFPVPPRPGLVPSCAEGGVFGVLPGMIGTFQAAEALKLVMGLGEALIGRLLHLDTLSMKIRQFQLRKDPQCPLCGENPIIHELVDYEAFCGISDEPNRQPVPEISPTELSQRLGSDPGLQLIDVREPFEREIVRLDRARLIPLGSLRANLDQLDRSRPIVLHCKGGTRSEEAAQVLLENGFTQVTHLRGGIIAWVEEIEPHLSRY